MASPRAGTAQKGGSITCELETTQSSNTLRVRDDAAIAITSSVVLKGGSGGGGDACLAWFNRDR